MQVDKFDFQNGRRISSRYKVVSLLGKGWEGEVYLVEEIATGIERTAKFFYPHRNKNNKVAEGFARKLYRSKDNPSVVQYLNQESIMHKSQRVTCLISEYVEGEILSEMIESYPSKRLPEFEALHLLAAITNGLAIIHEQGEYHGDLHTGNILVQRKGIHFEIKLIDPFDWKDGTINNIKKDVCDLIRVFYDCLGGRKYYAAYPSEIKAICCGLKNSLIVKKFKDATILKRYLETFTWA